MYYVFAYSTTMTSVCLISYRTCKCTTFTEVGELKFIWGHFVCIASPSRNVQIMDLVLTTMWSLLPREILMSTLRREN